MTRWTLAAAWAALALPAYAGDAAVLLGVSRYQELRSVGDAAELVTAAPAMTAAGYSVMAVANGSGRAMQDALARFVDEADDATRLVVALSGRFVTDGQRSWLLPADASAPAFFGLNGAVSLESILAVLAATPGQAVLVLGLDRGDDDTLDAYLSEGIGTLDAPQGVTILTGSPDFARDVVTDAIAVPGADILAYTRDTRRTEISGYAPATLVMQTAAVEPQDVAQENPAITAWAAAQLADTEESYREFLFAYPDSSAAPEARRRLDRIENDPVRLARLSEEALSLSRDARREIQRDLTLLGFNTRGVDGIFGNGTRGAIRNWQQGNGFSQTGFLTAEQISRIDAQARLRAAEIEVQEAEARAEAARLDRAYWEETGQRGNLAGYQAYLDRYPEGRFAAEAKAGIAALTPPPAPTPAPPPVQEDRSQAVQDRNHERSLNINPILARLIETRLQQLGFDPGPVDGRIDDATRRAVSRYQDSRNLPRTGYLSQQTLAQLLADTLR